MYINLRTMSFSVVYINIFSGVYTLDDRQEKYNIMIDVINLRD